LNGIPVSISEEAVKGYMDNLLSSDEVIELTLSKRKTCEPKEKKLGMINFD
jgi:hypothetical protein